jgi:1-acyl-sn-glycerol-3-phosphate acyltransferase
MSEGAPTATAGSVAAEQDTRSLRVALSPLLFRGMMVSMAAACVALHRVTGNQELAWRFAKARARDLESLLGVRTRLHGIERLDPDAAYVYAPNHQSHLDILALLGHLPGATRFAAKHSLWRHPVVGAVLDSLGMIPIDRENPDQAVAALNGVAPEGQSFVVFPEGGRSRDGRLRPFKNGAFVLAIRLGIPVVPVVCIGTRKLMPRGSRLTVVPGEIDLIVEDPIPTIGLAFADRHTLAARVRDVIAKHHTGW